MDRRRIYRTQSARFGNGEKGGYKEYEAGPRAPLKRGRTACVPDAGSFPHQDNPRETEKILLSFFSEPT